MPTIVSRILCVVAAIVALTLQSASADQFLPASGGWRTYINDRYGMRFYYPADIFSP